MTRACVDCGASLAKRDPQTKRCHPCAREAQRKANRKHDAKRASKEQKHGK